jgi:DNA-binding transcriptional ArsR family regulator
MHAVARAIAEPRRAEILQLVAEREMTVGEIADEFEVSQPAISQHLRVLKDVGLVAERREGTRHLFRAQPEGFAELRSFIDSLWGYRLARLKQVVEKDKNKTRRKKNKGARRG